jgi:hypothetical protein
MITAGADPTDVQRALRHSSLRITLETYVRWGPKRTRPRNVVGGLIGQTSRNLTGGQIPVSS